jgi:hypothetical protein
LVERSSGRRVAALAVDSGAQQRLTVVHHTRRVASPRGSSELFHRRPPSLVKTISRPWLETQQWLESTHIGE